MTDTPLAEIDQHCSDSIGFKEHHQCPDEIYAQVREYAINYLREETDWGEYVALSGIQLRRWWFEDGVVSFDATHPAVTHEDEISTDAEDVTPVEDVEEGTVLWVDSSIKKFPKTDSSLSIEVNNQKVELPQDFGSTTQEFLDELGWPSDRYEVYQARRPGAHLNQGDKCSDPMVVSQGDEFVIVPSTVEGGG